MGDKIKLEIIGLTAGHSQKNSYTLILGESDGHLKLPVVIGTYEAQSIALVIEDIKPQRPLTHDLMFDALNNYGITITEVVIDKLLEGVFYAKLITSKDGELHEIDSRTSDAIAMALRANCPIYTYSTIMEDAGVVYEKSEDTEVPIHKKEQKVKKETGSDYSKMTIDQLNKELDRAIQVEDYDKAALIRDEINARS